MVSQKILKLNVSPIFRGVGEGVLIYASRRSKSMLYSVPANCSAVPENVFTPIIVMRYIFKCIRLMITLFYKD